jgi:hypothetical protein
MPMSDNVSQQTVTGSHLAFSPYRTFSREEWAKLRADTPMTLVPRELKEFSGLIEDLSMSEVEQIYLPLSRLLNLHVAAAQELHTATSRFLGRKDRHVPYILGVAGSPAVGKSTTARVLQALLARWPDHPVWSKYRNGSSTVGVFSTRPRPLTQSLTPYTLRRMPVSIRDCGSLERKRDLWSGRGF